MADLIDPYEGYTTSSPLIQLVIQLKEGGRYVFDQYQNKPWLRMMMENRCQDVGLNGFFSINVETTEIQSYYPPHEIRCILFEYVDENAAHRLYTWL